MSIIAKNAVNEAKAVARLAVDAAKNELIEQLTPTIQAIIDGQLRRGALGEDVDRLRRAADGYGETEFEEGKDMKKDKKDKMESVAALFPGVSEMAEADDSGYDDTSEGLEEADGTEHPGVDEAKDDEVDETLELSETELESIYHEALQLEVDVKNGFSDMAKPHELGAGAKAQYQSDGANLADYKSGEAEWDNVDPPAKKKWTVESLKPLIRQGLAENKAVRAQNAKLTEMVKAMHAKLSEMNLLNSKILHVNKFMTNHNRLTSEQKRSVIESLDRGTTVKEVKRIFSILENSFKAAGAVSESTRRPRADSQKLRTSGAPNAKVLRESADRSEGNSSGYDRLKQLAGLVGG